MDINLNVVDLRNNLRRSNMSRRSSDRCSDDRRKSDRRLLSASASKNGNGVQRIWLTPGERALIEDLYLLEDE